MKKLKTLTGPDATAVPPEDRSDPHPIERGGPLPGEEVPLDRRPNRGSARDDAGPRWVA